MLDKRPSNSLFLNTGTERVQSPFVELFRSHLETFWMTRSRGPCWGKGDCTRWHPAVPSHLTHSAIEWDAIRRSEALFSPTRDTPWAGEAAAEPKNTALLVRRPRGSLTCVLQWGWVNKTFQGLGWLALSVTFKTGGEGQYSFLRGLWSCWCWSKQYTYRLVLSCLSFWFTGWFWTHDGAFSSLLECHYLVKEKHHFLKLIPLPQRFALNVAVPSLKSVGERSFVNQELTLSPFKSTASSQNPRCISPLT